MPIGTPYPSPEHRALAVDTVRFVGDPVAVVVACDRYVARDAVDAIVVDYESLPAVVDPETAMTGKPAVLHADFPNNVALGPLPSGTGVGRQGDIDDTAVDAAFQAADVVIAQRMVNQRLAPCSIEARGVVAHYEPGREALTIWSSTQNPHILRTFVAQTLGLGEDCVRAIAPEVGGGFGAKINIYGEEYVATPFSKRLGLPVKWIEDRSEAFLATVHGRDLIAYVELAATRDGKVLGLRMRIIADIGAYNMLLTARVPTHSMTMANATYAFPAIRATLTEVFTNKTPTDAYRGAGRPEATYFVERAMDMLARELGMDPAELRRKNFIQPEQFPYRTQMGAVYDSGDYEKALDCALRVAGWEELKRARDAARADGRLVGLGLSMYVESCGLGPSSTRPSSESVVQPEAREGHRMPAGPALVNRCAEAHRRPAVLDADTQRAERPRIPHCPQPDAFHQLHRVEELVAEPGSQLRAEPIMVDQANRYAPGNVDDRRPSEVVEAPAQVRLEPACDWHAHHDVVCRRPACVALHGQVAVVAAMPDLERHVRLVLCRRRRRQPHRHAAREHHRSHPLRLHRIFSQCAWHFLHCSLSSFSLRSSSDTPGHSGM